MDYRNDTLWLCIDRQGFRKIDVSDRANPVEIGKYFNPVLYDDVRPANNEVVVIDRYAFISLDHCGMEVVDISSDSMEHLFLYDPLDCVTANWSGAAMHTNQLAFSGDSLLFVSGADSEVLVFDIKNRATPLLVGAFGETGNMSATWGLDVRGEYAALAYVNPPLNIPYAANWGGLRILKWKHYTDTLSGLSGPGNQNQVILNVFPNPSTGLVHIETGVPASRPGNLYVVVHNVKGEKTYVSKTFNASAKIDLSSLPNGIYFIQLHSDEGLLTNRKVIISK
jgi:hypothetical protein